MRLSFWLAAIFVAFIGLASPCNAQATRTWVSGVGDDANPCSRTAPCKTFAGAISKTAPAGEINCLDPGGYGAVTITKSLTVNCTGTFGSVLVSGTNGIVINAASTDRVDLEGIEIEGLGTGLNGVSITGATGQVSVVKCSIRHFTQNGINLASSTAGARVFVRDSFIAFNAGGVNVAGTNNIGSIVNTEIDANSSFAAQANGAGNVLGIAYSILNASPAGLSLVNGGSAQSFGPSSVVGGSGAFTVTNPFN